MFRDTIKWTACSYIHLYSVTWVLTFQKKYLSCLYPENGVAKSLQNSGAFLPNYTASHGRKLYSFTVSKFISYLVAVCV
jgi:hypothetical protein